MKLSQKISNKSMEKEIKKSRHVSTLYKPPP